MPNPPGDRAFVRLYLDVVRWMSNQDAQVCLACMSQKDVKQGARSSGNRLPVWACSACRTRLERLRRSADKRRKERE